MRTWMSRLRKLAWLTLALLPLLALARGGGGQHYTPSRSGGSSSSGSRSSGSSGSSGWSGGGGSSSSSGPVFGPSSGPSEPVSNSTFCCLMTVFVIVVVAVVLSQRRQKGKTGLTAQERREADLRTRVSAEDVQRWVGAIQAKDPKFDLTALLAEVARLFTVLQDAWVRRDLKPIRPFLSDATWQRLNVQLHLMAAQGVRNALAELRVLDLQLIGLEQSEGYDTVHVRVHAQARDADVPAGASDEEALAAARSAPLEDFTEVWSFVRKPGAQSRPSGEGLGQGRCPNCGAPFKGGAANNCEFCGAIVNSGNYSWTLAEITQGFEFVPSEAAPEGLAEMRAKDPALNTEILEDRASLIFWKWIEAQSRGESGPLAKLSTQEFLAKLEADLRGLKEHRRHWVFIDCAVGAVRVRRFVQPPDGFDLAQVEILWSARKGTAAEGHREPPTREVSSERWMFTLRRAAGATTNAEAGMSTYRCPSCRAPLTDSLSPSCDFCGTVLSVGEKDWVLEAAGPATV